MVVRVVTTMLSKVGPCFFDRYRQPFMGQIRQLTIGDDTAGHGKARVEGGGVAFHRFGGAAKGFTRFFHAGKVGAGAVGAGEGTDFRNGNAI